MSLQAEIDRLGGIEPLEAQFNPLNQEEISAIETEIGAPLPADYVWLLTTYGEFLFANSVEFEPVKRQPEYLHAAELSIPNSGDLAGSQVATVYGKNLKQNSITVLKKLRAFRDRMPEDFLPFADDGLGNQLCLHIKPGNQQPVYWWDHELEWDEEDYELETGTVMLSAAKYQNVYLVATSLQIFFERLIIAAQA